MTYYGLTMENMTFYDLDFVEMRFLFQNTVYSCLKHEKKSMTFMTLTGPADGI